MRPLPNRRQALQRVAWTLGAAGTAALTTGCANPLARAANSGSSLELIGYGALPTVPQYLHGVSIGGLSALAWDESTDLWWALSDARGRHGPTRCFTFRLAPFAPDQDITPRWESVVFLQGPQPAHIGGRDVDPEGMTLRRNSANGATTLLWSSEGNIARKIAPAIFESTLQGRLLRTLTLPPLLRELGAPDRGPRINRTLEGVAVTPSGAHLWAAMEGSLKQDSTAEEWRTRSAPRRITRFDLGSGHADRQIAYVPDPFARAFWMPPFAHANGLSDLLAPTDDELWVLERAFNPAKGFRIRLYAADLRDTSNTLDMDALQPGGYTPVAKRLLADFNQLGLPTVDNLEGIAFGPPLADGRRTLLVVSDNNFNPLELTQFVVLAAPARRSLPRSHTQPT